MKRQCSRRSVTLATTISTDDSITRLGSSLPARAPRSMSRKRPKRLVDQDQPEGLHRFEVAVERRGHDAGFPGHLAQAQAAETAVVEQFERRGDDGPPGRLLALLARRAFAGTAAARPVRP